jgi:hypothetical protein
LRIATVARLSIAIAIIAAAIIVIIVAPGVCLDIAVAEAQELVFATRKSGKTPKNETKATGGKQTQ